MKAKKSMLLYRMYRMVLGFLRLVYPKTGVSGLENLPDEPALFVGNHAQMHGPIVCELYFPVERYTWCAGEMMHLKEVPAYAYRDFWSGKPGYIRWFFKLASYAIAPLCVLLFNNANTIGVYHDARVLSTFRSSVEKLQEGKGVVVFPEQAKPYNNILCDFQDGFLDVARIYYRKTGRVLPIVPIYIAPDLKKLYLCRPTYFRPEAPIAEEKQRICSYLMDEISEFARSLPRHTVVPYMNVAKKYYPCNIPDEVNTNEKTGR